MKEERGEQKGGKREGRGDGMERGRMACRKKGQEGERERGSNGEGRERRQEGTFRNKNNPRIFPKEWNSEKVAKLSHQKIPSNLVIWWQRDRGSANRCQHPIHHLSQRPPEGNEKRKKISCFSQAIKKQN